MKNSIMLFNQQKLLFSPPNQTLLSIFPSELRFFFFLFSFDKQEKEKEFFFNSVPYTLSSWNHNYSSGPSSHSNKISIAGSTAK